MKLDFTPTQLKICKAAAELFSAHGYRGTTLKKIGKKAAYTEMTVIRQFKTKHHLFECAVSYTIEQTPLNVPISQSGTFAEQIRDWARKYAKEFSKAERLQRLFFYAALDHPETSHRFMVEFMAPLYVSVLDRFRRAQQCGEVRVDIDPNASVRALFGMMFYHYFYASLLHAYTIRQFGLRGENIETYIDIWLSGVLNVSVG